MAAHVKDSKWDEICSLLLDISQKLDRLLEKESSPTKRSWAERDLVRSRPVNKEEVIARFKELGHLGAVGAEFFISSERVRQIISAYESKTGNHLERVRFRPPLQPRVQWSCEKCGTTRMVRPGDLKNTKVCAKCHLDAQMPVPVDEMEAVIDGLKKDGRGKWASLARRWGIKRNEQFRCSRRVFSFLLRHARHEDISQIWPEGVPHFLRKRKIGGSATSLSLNDVVGSISNGRIDH
jgi:hypothetical protein